jgi:UDP:flavonoid glycosyltransferase YjiC (YdhE family)
VATAGAGGDLQPLVAAALALRSRGHETFFVGDHSVQRVLAEVQQDTEVLSSELDLGPRLAGSIRDGMAATNGDLAAAGPLVQERMAVWAEQAAEPVAAAVRRHRPAMVMTSLFGVEVLALASPPCPWVVINSTFYIGPNPPRPPEQDFGPRAIPLLSRYAALLEAADLVLHATDQVFDFSFDRLPTHHRYVGPLGIWEPQRVVPEYLDQSGDPWVLVSISSQLQDDMPLAMAALAALARYPVRIVLTVGPHHDPLEVGSIPPNARIERTISHAAVLEHGRLLVSHAGHGSVMKALWYGRPMVLVPWGRDQPGVAARAAALGVAEVVGREDASGETLTVALSRALSSETMAAAAGQHATRLQASDPQTIAATALETLIGPRNARRGHGGGVKPAGSCVVRRT